MDKKNHLLDLLEKSHQAELAFITNLSEEERVARGTEQNWAVKDEIAHIAAWKEISSERISAFMAEEEPHNYDDVDAANDEIFHRFREKTWQEVEEFHERSYNELAEDVRLMSEDDLMDSQRYEWLKGRSLWRRTIHNGYFHP